MKLYLSRKIFISKSVCSKMVRFFFFKKYSEHQNGILKVNRIFFRFEISIHKHKKQNNWAEYKPILRWQKCGEWSGITIITLLKVCKSQYNETVFIAKDFYFYKCLFKKGLIFVCENCLTKAPYSSYCTLDRRGTRSKR